METIALQEEEVLSSKLQGFPVTYDRKVKGFKERAVVQNVQKKIVENISSTKPAVHRCSVRELF